MRGDTGSSGGGTAGPEILTSEEPRKDKPAEAPHGDDTVTELREEQSYDRTDV